MLIAYPRSARLATAFLPLARDRRQRPQDNRDPGRERYRPDECVQPMLTLSAGNGEAAGGDALASGTLASVLAALLRVAISTA